MVFYWHEINQESKLNKKKLKEKLLKVKKIKQLHPQNFLNEHTVVKFMNGMNLK